MLFFENKTVHKCAEFYGINQKNSNKNCLPKRIICPLILLRYVDLIGLEDVGFYAIGL